MNKRKIEHIQVYTSHSQKINVKKTSSPQPRIRYIQRRAIEYRYSIELPANDGVFRPEGSLVHSRRKFSENRNSTKIQASQDREGERERDIKRPIAIERRNERRKRKKKKNQKNKNLRAIDGQPEESQVFLSLSLSQHVVQKFSLLQLKEKEKKKKQRN